MTGIHSHSPSNDAPARAQLDNSPSGRGDAPLGAFYSTSPPLAETGPSYCSFMQTRWGQDRRAWFATALFWFGETLGAACLFIISIIGLFLGDILQ